MTDAIDRKPSWLMQLPMQLAGFLLAVCLISSQLNPCDSVISIARGDSILFMVMAFCVGLLVALDGLLLGSRELDRNSTRLWFVVTCVAFSGWLGFCTWQQIGRGNARFAFNGCWQWIAELVLLLSIIRMAECSRTRSELLSLMIALAVGTIGYAVYQYMVSMPRDRMEYAANPELVLSKLGIVPGSSDALLYQMRQDSLEPIGPFALTNSMAGFLASWFVFGLVWLVGKAAMQLRDGTNYGANNGKRWLPMVGAIVLLGSAGWVLLLTKSRTAWLATLVGLGLGFVAHPVLRARGLQVLRQYMRVVVSAVAVAGLAMAGFLIRDTTLIGEAGKSLAYRFDYWRAAVALIEQRPWFGFGPNTFQSNYNRVKVITASESPADPHNFLLETGFAGGIPLLGLLVLLLLLLVWATARLSGSSSDGDVSDSKGPERSTIGLAAGGLLAIIGQVGFHFFSSSDDVLNSVMIFVALSAAVFVYLSRSRWFQVSPGVGALSLASAMVMLLHLLASGGWMLPGVMNSFCVLAGIGMSCLAFKVPLSKNRYSVACRWIALGLCALCLLAFARTVAFPIERSTVVLEAIKSGELNELEASRICELANSDALEPELPRLVANQCVQVILQRGGNLSRNELTKWVKAFEASSNEYLARDPNNWIPLTECGKWNSMLVKQLNIPDKADFDKIHIELADKYFRAAAKEYPSSIPAQLQAAVGSAWAGDFVAAKEYLSVVSEIESKTQHTDRKLKAAMVFVPTAMEIAMSKLAPEYRVREMPGMARAEPVMLWLRTNVP